MIRRKAEDEKERIINAANMEKEERERLLEDLRKKEEAEDKAKHK